MQEQDRKLKRASYRHAISWIAGNDEPECTDEEEMAGWISVCLIADIFGTEPERVARDVVRLRAQMFE